MIRDHHLLRIALAHFMGQTLTPEIAQQIEDVALHGGEQAIDPGQFGQAVHGDYTVQVESLRAILPELHALHVLHWQETEKYRHAMRLAPDYAAFSRYERDGGLIQVTARHRGELVGQLRVYLTFSMHNQARISIAEEDTLFVHPEHRTSGIGLKLIRFVEKCLDDLEVEERYADSKLINNAGVLMRRVGYTHIADRYCKIFKKGN